MGRKKFIFSENKCACALRAYLYLAPWLAPCFAYSPSLDHWIQVLYCERPSAKIYALKRTVNISYLLATGQVAFRHFRGYARLVRVRHLRPKLHLSLASVRRHLADRTPVRRKILKPTPKIFGVPYTKCSLAARSLNRRASLQNEIRIRLEDLERINHINIPSIGWLFFFLIPAKETCLKDDLKQALLCLQLPQSSRQCTKRC